MHRSPPNILLISADTLRADHLSCHGYGRPTSPNLDRFAQSAVHYTNCISHVPWTIPSFTTILSGLDPIAHRVVSSPWNIPDATQVHFADERPTLPEWMREAGYTTMAIDNLVEMKSHPSWFVRGFHTYQNLTDRLGLRHHHVLGEQVTDAFFNLAAPCLSRSRPWFAFLHYWDPHLPYNYPRRYDAILPASRPDPVKHPKSGAYLPRCGYDSDVTPRYVELIAQYDRSIRYLDDEMGRLLGWLDKTGQAENTVVVFTGDHGECMVEHGLLFDHSYLYDATVHVPLMIRAPGGRPMQVEDLVQHHDLAPTLLSMAGGAPLPMSTGIVLPPFSTRPNIRDFAISTQGGWTALRSIRTLTHKLICEYDMEQPPTAKPATIKRHELYDLRDDPDEIRDLAASEPGIVQSLSSRLEAWRTAAMEKSQGNDPLLDPAIRVDFRKFPGDPELVEFYNSLRQPA